MKPDYKRLDNDLYRENISIAGMQRRIAAYLIDCLLTSMVVSLMLTQTQSEIISHAYDTIRHFTESVRDSSGLDDRDMKDLIYSTNSAFMVILNLMLVYAVLDIVYNSIFTYVYGATLGKVITKIKIVDISSFDRPDLLWCIIRSICKYIFGSMLYFGFVFAIFTKHKMSLHDRLCKTIVIDN